MPPFTHRRTVEFHETDAAGLVHFSNYLRYAEAAEHALFRAIEFPILQDHPDGGFCGWPRVRVQAKYSAPLQTGAPIRVQLGVQEIKDKAIVYAFRIYEEHANQLVAKGSFATMYTHRDPVSQAMKSQHVPPELIERLRPYGC